MQSSLLRRLFPFLQWPRPTRSTLHDDVIAGFTVALVATPQALAHAQLAGVPAYWGLYAVLLPAVIGTLFGSCALLSTGTTALCSLLTAASLAPFATVGSEKFLACAVLLALLAGLIQLALGALRLGLLLNFLSQPVLIGFINAAAVLIALSQVPPLLGISTTGMSVVQGAWYALVHLTGTHLPTFAFGAGAIVVQLLFRRFLPRFPGVLATVVGCTVISKAISFQNMGGAVVGAIPAGIPGFSLPMGEWTMAIDLLPAAFVLALISFMEAVSSSKVISAKTGAHWDENQELLGQGLAKLAAAFTHTMPVSGSFARSALNFSANARTGVSSLVCAGVVLLVLLFFTDALYHVPQSVLAAVIIVPIYSVLDIKGMRKAWLARRDDGIAAIATFTATMVFAPNIQNGVLTGILLSLVMLLVRRTRPRAVEVGLHPDGVLRDAIRWGLPVIHPQLAVLRWDDSLLFVNCAHFEESVLGLSRHRPQAKILLIASGGINDVDASGVETLERLRKRLAERGMTLALSNVKKQVQDVFDRAGLTASLGADNIFPTDQQALTALIARLPPAATAEPPEN